MTRVTPDTIHDAIKALAPGDELVLADGIYLGPILLPNDKGGPSPEQPTTIRAENTHGAMIVGVKGSGDGLQIGVESLYPAGCHNVRVEGLQLAWSRRDGLRGYGSDCVVVNCWSHHNGLAVNVPEKGPTGQGIAWFGDQHRCLFLNNLVEANGSNLWDHGFYVYGWEHRFVGNTIRWNKGYGIHGYAKTTAFDYERNVVYGNGGAGLYATSRNGETKSIRVVDNISVANGTYGLVLIEGDAMPEVRGNVLIGNKQGHYATGGSCPLKTLPDLPEAMA